MHLSSTLFDAILEQAITSPRKRMHFDLRTQADLSAYGCINSPDLENPNRQDKDSSQRMLNVLMPETVIPIHRHTDTSETVIICRGAVREEFYDDQGNKIAEFLLEAGGDCPGVQVPKGMYHTCVCLIPGSVIFEARDGAYDSETAI